MVDRVPLLIEATSYNSGYLATKAEKLGHWLLQTYLVTLAVHWSEDLLSITERYNRLEKLRHLAKVHDLILQEEVRPVATALFETGALIVHLGLDQSLVGGSDWYTYPGHPFVDAIGQILDEIANWSYVQRLEFIVSNGSDPLTGLQIQLDRQIFSLSHQPSSIVSSLETQKIYSFSA